MNQFTNFLRFINVVGDMRALNDPIELPCLPIRPGDQIRVLLPRTELTGLTPELCKICLVTGDTEYEVGEPVGTIRAQQAELYTSLRLVVNDTPSSGNYRQFALMRSNDQQVIGTFRSQQPDLNQYMVELKNFFEAYPYAPVLAEVRGNVLSLSIFKADRFRMTDETLSVGLGTVRENNMNSPSIRASALNAFTQPPQTTYLLKVGKSIQAGNIFNLNGVAYTAVQGDTPERILEVLNGGSDRLTVNSGTLGETQALPGSQLVQNTSKPNVIAQWLSNDGTYDYFKVRVLGSWQAGNVIQVTASGKTTITRTVTDTDTQATLEFDLNPDAGQYRLISGGLPQVTVLPGSQMVEGTNFPSLTAVVEDTLAEAEVRRWQVSVSPDVEAGNVYSLEALTYTAIEGDDADSVARALGLDGPYSVILRPEGQPVTAYARKGKRYGPSNIADVRILDGPVILKSRQVIVEVSVPQTVSGIIQLGLVDVRNGDVRAVSNYFRLDVLEEYSLVEVLGISELYGYEYHEPGLSQRLRLPVSLGVRTPYTESETRVGLDGYQRKRAVSIGRTVDLVSDVVGEEFCDTLTAWLQHEEVIIDGTVYSMRDGMETPVLSPMSRSLQFSAKLTVSGNVRHNRGRQLGVGPLAFGRLEWLPPTYGVNMYLITTDGRYLPVVREMSVRAGEYRLEVFSAADDVVVSVYDNGLLRTQFRCQKLSRTRPTELLRIEPHGLTSVRVSTDGLLSVDFVCAVQTLPEMVEYTCEVVEKEAVDEFSQDFNEDFSI